MKDFINYVILIIVSIIAGYYFIYCMKLQAIENMMGIVDPPTPSPVVLWINNLESYELDESYPRDYCKIDVDGEEVCGCLQYKRATFLADALAYHVFPSAEPAELNNFYLDCEAQKKVAFADILNNKNAWTKWRTSVAKGLGKPPLN